MYIPKIIKKDSTTTKESKKKVFKKLNFLRRIGQPLKNLYFTHPLNFINFKEG